MDGSGLSKPNAERGEHREPGEFTADRRGADRFRSVCRIARVRRTNDVGLWRVRNISDEGMMLAANVEVRVGEELEIALSDSVVVNGTIVWSKEGRCGVHLAQPIDTTGILATLAEEQHDEGRRALRLPVAVEAIVTLPDGARSIDLVDISQHGAGFRYDRRLEPGTALDLLLPSIDQQRRALVRWSHGHRGGLWFTSPLDRTHLESVARFGN